MVLVLIVIGVLVLLGLVVGLFVLFGIGRTVTNEARLVPFGEPKQWGVDPPMDS